MKVELRIPSGSYNLHFISNSQNLLLSMRVFGLRNSANTLRHTILLYCFPIDNRRHTISPISCKISFEQPSVGLASLTQKCILVLVLVNKNYSVVLVGDKCLLLVLQGYSEILVSFSFFIKTILEF